MDESFRENEREREKRREYHRKNKLRIEDNSGINEVIDDDNHLHSAPVRQLITEWDRAVAWLPHF